MGHYLSEMEPNWRSDRQKSRAARRQAAAKQIAEEIEESGIEYVLADIILGEGDYYI